jgi:hypothetical protein
MLGIDDLIKRTFTHAESAGLKGGGAAYVHRASLTNQVKGALLDPSVLPVIYGRTGVGKTSIFQTAFREAQQKRPGGSFVGEPIVVRLAKLKDDFDRTLLSVLREEADTRSAPDAAPLPDELFKLFDRAHRLVVFEDFHEVIAARPDFVVELLDFAKGFCGQGVRQGHSELAIVFSGTESELVSMIAGRTRRPTKAIHILPFSASELYEIIKNGVNKINELRPEFSFQPAAVKEIVLLSFGVPATTHILAREIALCAAEKGRSEVSEVDLEEVTGTPESIMLELTGGLLNPNQLRRFSECQCAMVVWAGHKKEPVVRDDFVTGLEGRFDPQEVRDSFGHLSDSGLFVADDEQQSIELREWLTASIAMLELRRRAAKSTRAERDQLKGLYQYLLGLAEDSSAESDSLESSSVPQPVGERYRAGIVAITTDDGAQILGTGFLTAFADKVYAVTCAHVLRSIRKSEGQSVTLKPLVSESELLHATVCWMDVPQGVEPKNWTAAQDIAILRFDAPLLSQLKPLILSQESCIGKAGCFCFAYLEKREHKGAWIEGISCGREVADRFVELGQSGKTLIDKGASGAPLSDAQGNIAGMVQAFLKGEDVAYLTPAQKIQTVLERLQSEGRQSNGAICSCRNIGGSNLG